MISFIAHPASPAVSDSPLMSAPISVGQLSRPAPGPVRAPDCRARPSGRRRSRISPASATASADGSIGCDTTASARDQVASHPSSTRPITSSTGGQS